MTKLAVPVSYLEGFVPEPAVAFSELWRDLAWERRGSTPRREYYANDVGVPYVYGKGAGVREYLPQAWHPRMRELARTPCSGTANRDLKSAFSTAMRTRVTTSAGTRTTPRRWTMPGPSPL